MPKEKNQHKSAAASDEKFRDFFTTTSPSMDILISSNLERLLFFASDFNDKLVAELMGKLNTEGSYKVAEDERFFAFLDINPLTKGHTLVVPKQEVDYIFDLDDEDLAAMHVFAKKVARAIEKAFPCKKVGEAVIGLEVPHAHIHLIPMQKESDMLFSNPKLKLSDEEFKAVAEAIRAAF